MFFCFILIFVLWIIFTNINIKTTNITVKNKKIPDSFSGFRLAQVSDLHNRDWGDKLIKALEKAKPDITVITGDLADASHTDIPAALRFAERAVKIAPVYYVTGNHEARLKDFSALVKGLTDAGVNVLNDKAVLLDKGGEAINLIGISDPDFTERDIFEGIQESIVEAKLSALIKEDCFNIVLCHRPELFNAYIKAGADLAVTGHAHGGQIKLPFIGGLFAPNQGLFPEYTSGLYRRENTDMIVSRGLGSSVLPIRINNMPELIIADLNK